MLPVLTDGSNRTAQQDMLLGGHLILKGTMIWLFFNGVFNCACNWDSPASYRPVCIDLSCSGSGSGPEVKACVMSPKLMVGQHDSHAMVPADMAVADCISMPRQALICICMSAWQLYGSDQTRLWMINCCGTAYKQRCSKSAHYWSCAGALGGCRCRVHDQQVLPKQRHLRPCSCRTRDCSVRLEPRSKCWYAVQPSQAPAGAGAADQQAWSGGTSLLPDGSCLVPEAFAHTKSCSAAYMVAYQRASARSSY